MLEWLKRHAWKACKLQKGFGGSNPPLSAKDFLTRMSPSLLERMSFRKDLHRMPVADCGDYVEIPLSPRFPVADCGAFEVGEPSEVGALESPSSEGMKQRHCTFGAITSAKPTLPLAQRATNMSESELNKL